MSRPDARNEGRLVWIATRFTAWAEKWFPDAFIFVALAVVIVSLGALVNGASPLDISQAFGNGFWSLITFTMQMAFVAIGGYVVASSAPAAWLIARLATAPRTGVGAVGLVATVSLLASLLNWGLSLIFSGLLVIALAKRPDLRMDYRAAGAAAYLGLGSVWALGLSSSAAQLQANTASLPKSLLPITGVIPFSETIFLWQSMALAAIVTVVSIAVAIWSAPGPAAAVTAEDMGINISRDRTIEPAPPAQPGEWLEHSPILTILIVLLGTGWIFLEFSRQDVMVAISNLNTYNFIFVVFGLVLIVQDLVIRILVEHDSPGLAILGDGLRGEYIRDGGWSMRLGNRPARAINRRRIRAAAQHSKQCYCGTGVFPKRSP